MRNYRFSENDRGQRLWRKAKTLIPGGGMLLSKRAEMFLPGLWPSYFSSAKGIRVRDIDRREFRDFYLMGVGTNSLGYAHPAVDRAVRNQIKVGNMSSLNFPGEVELAEKLVSMHPWSDMARFTRSGGEAMAVAVRIARAATGRDHVAVCGYHGWHDWYLSLNLGDPNGLDDLLLPGLEPFGVPSALRGLTHAFRYGDVGALQEVIEERPLAAIVLEVGRGSVPDVEFLSEVRRIAEKESTVLIFDECTSGFRNSFGGLHLTTGIEPDMAMFGKALGNGYAVNAVLGKSAIMEAAQKTFVSSTFWTEAMGSTAALATLEVMEDERSWERISQVGRSIKNVWHSLASLHSLEIEITGLDALATFRFKDERHNLMKTVITQEMLKAGFLAGTSLYTSTKHEQRDIDDYSEALEKVFYLIATARDNNNLEALLQRQEAHRTFERLAN